MTEKYLELAQSPLGQKSEYVTTYTKDLLFPISRQFKRKELGIIADQLPFFGYDIWNAYEISWLNNQGKPEVRIAEIMYNANSEFIIESKSLKLYLNSFNNSKFIDMSKVKQTITQDLNEVLLTNVNVTLLPVDVELRHEKFSGKCIDDIDIICDANSLNANNLITEEEYISETIYTHLLKSNCLVTGQADFGSLQISYAGRKINHAGLLKYIVSYRNHNEFHEQCIERIFLDIQKYCNPHELSIYGRYTRRGGIDINPFRTMSATNKWPNNIRLARQ